MWLPRALAYGCSYKTFWRLNPHKLESFRKAHELELKEQAEMQDSFAWLIGTYTSEAMGMWLGKNHNPYPSRPRGLEKTESAKSGRGEMSDGAKFAAFAAAHRQEVRKHRGK